MQPIHQQSGSAFKILSNEYEDFAQGSVYAGGSGYIKDICYALWDYEGKQPKDSITAVRLTFQPTDGSNDNKEVIQFFSAGQSVEVFPDPTGCHLMSEKRDAQSNQTNWAAFLAGMQKQCGLEKGRLSTQAGIRALTGTLLTITQGDQPHRDFQDQPAQQPGQGQGQGRNQGKRKMLLPVKATFPWDPNYAGLAQRIGIQVGGGQPQQMGMGQMVPPPAFQPQAPAPQMGNPALAAGFPPQPPNFGIQAPAPQANPLWNQNPAQTMAMPAQVPAPALAPAPVMGMPAMPPQNGQITAAAVVSQILSTRPSIPLGGADGLLQVAMGMLANVDRGQRMAILQELQSGLPALAQQNGWLLSATDIMRVQ